MAATVVATFPKIRIAVVQKILGRVVVRKGVAELLSGPGCDGMLGDGHVDEPSTSVPEDDEHEQ